jgi:hypothetical protein
MMYGRPSPLLVPAGTEPLDTADHVEFARIMDGLRRAAITEPRELGFDAPPALTGAAPAPLLKAA